MNKTFCDICGGKILDGCETKYKVKRLDCSWHESWWTNLDVHDACWRELCNVV